MRPLTAIPTATLLLLGSALPGAAQPARDEGVATIDVTGEVAHVQMKGEACRVRIAVDDVDGEFSTLGVLEDGEGRMTLHDSACAFIKITSDEFKSGIAVRGQLTVAYEAKTRNNGKITARVEADDIDLVLADDGAVIDQCLSCNEVVEGQFKF